MLDDAEVCGIEDMDKHEQMEKNLIAQVKEVEQQLKQAHGVQKKKDNRMLTWRQCSLEDSLKIQREEKSTDNTQSLTTLNLSVKNPNDWFKFVPFGCC